MDTISWYGRGPHDNYADRLTLSLIHISEPTRHKKKHSSTLFASAPSLRITS
ncbi:hypothetical protein [Paenibacillus amylolyticus]|uniref:hypothetical protein n=1 Tax=Paenibacillus amylolyticus TaxID=1451 RepID=UPI003D9C3F47